MKCQACGRPAQGKYCGRHAQALEQLQNHYKTWVKAYGNIPWDEFMTRLSLMEETGVWIKEVIKIEMKKE